VQPDRYEVSSAGRQRVTGLIQRRGATPGIPPAMGFIFGGLFVAAGVWIVLMGVGVVKTDSASVHAPYWVLTAAGSSFLLGGLFVWSLAATELITRAKIKRLLPEHHGEPAFADYPWDPRQFQVSEWKDTAKAFAFAIGVTVFLSVFNWWAFVAGGAWMVKVIVVIFDVFLLILWWQAARQLGRAVKFGKSRILFDQFPFRPGQPVSISWQPGRGIHQVMKGRFTLRCIEQWIEIERVGRKQHSSVKQDCLWSAAWVLEQPRNFLIGDSVELRYELPGDAPTTSLSSPRAIFWELSVRLELLGLDFQKTYLVPVYSRV